MNELRTVCCHTPLARQFGQVSSCLRVDSTGPSIRLGNPRHHLKVQ